MSEDMHNIFFITGVARSGTSLAARLVDKHPDAAVMYETDFLRSNIFPRLKDNSFKAPFTVKNNPSIHSMGAFLKKLNEDTAFTTGEKSIEALKKISIEYYDYYKRLSRALIVGEKSPKYTFHIEELNLLFEKPKIVSIIRHPLALYASWKSFMPDELKLRSKIKYRLKRLFKKTDPMIGIERWCRFVDCYRAGKLSDCLIVRYEDFVFDTDNQMRRIYSYLGLAYDDAYARHENPKDSFNKYAHVKEACKAIDVKASGKKAKRLTQWEIKEVFKRVGDRLSTFGYSENVDALAREKI